MTNDRGSHDEPGRSSTVRARLVRVFGDVLPETTRDERPESGGVAEESAADDWLRSQVPPHHG